MGFNYLFIFPPCYVALCASKAHHRLGSESASWCLETSLFLRLPSQDGAISLPLLSLFFVFYIFSYLLSKTMGCFSGCLMSSSGIQKLFCGIYSAFKYSFDEFVGEKVVSPFYSSAIFYHSFLIHSSADGYLGCFHVLAFINNAAMNIRVHMSLSILVSLVCMPSSGIAGSLVD